MDKFYQTDNVMKSSVITSTAVAGVSFSSIFLWLHVVWQMESPYTPIFIGIVFSILGLIPIFTCLMFGNYNDKSTLNTKIDENKLKYKYKPTSTGVQLHRFKGTSNKTWQQDRAITTSDPLDASTLQNNDHIKTADAPNFIPEFTSGNNINDIIRANIIVSFGIFSLVIVFGSVVLFSFVLFHKDTKSLAAPLFLFTFIATTSAITFGGISISSTAAAIHMHTQLNVKDNDPLNKAKNCSYPEYKSFLIQGIFSAANNKSVTNPTGKTYTWGTHDPSGGGSATANNHKTVNAEQDKNKRRDAINAELETKLNDPGNGVAKRLQDVWKNTLNRKLTKLWSVQPFDVTFKISIVVLGILAILLIIGLIITIFINKNEVFIIIGISISVLASTSTFSSLIPANYHDKDNLKKINITNEDFEYKATQIMTLYVSKDSSDRAKKTESGQETVDVPEGQTILAKYVKDGCHFHTANAPTVQVTKDITAQTEGIAKANIIAVIGIASIVVKFCCLLLFSLIIFMGINSLTAPLFLFTFIVSVSAIVFGGIATSSTIAVFVLYNRGDKSKQAATEKAKGSSIILLISFIQSIFIGVAFYIDGSYIEGIIIGFLLYSTVSAIVSATTANSGIKKLFYDEGGNSGKDWSPILILTLSMGLSHTFHLLPFIL